MIRETEDKLRRIERFLANTNTIYDRADQILVMLNRADEQLKQVTFNQSENSIQFGALSNEWLLELSTAAAMQYLLSNGVTETELKELDNMGFTPEEVRAIHVLLRTEEDKALFKHLIRKEYVPAFQINPNRLSPEVNYILVYYSDRLMEQGKIDELEKMMNAILHTDEEHSLYPNAFDKNAYGMEYLDRLYAASGMLLEDNARILMALGAEMDSAKQKDLCGTIDRLANINALWGTVNEIAYDTRYFHGSGIITKSQQLYNGFRIGNLNLSAAGFSFTGEYQTAWIKELTIEPVGKNISELEWHPENRLEIQTRILTEIGEMSGQKFREKLSAMRKEQEELWMKYTVNTGIAVVTAFQPFAGAALGFLKGVASQSASGTALNGWKSLEKSGVLKPEFVSQYGSGSLGALQIAGNWIDYYKEMEYLKQSENIEKELRKVEWFGSISTFTAEREHNEGSDTKGNEEMTDTVNMGFYNPEGILDLKRWEAEGIGSVLGKKDGENENYEDIINAIKNELSQNNDWSTIPDDVIKLLDGGDIFTMDTEALEVAAGKISAAYKENQKNDLRLQERFQE